MNLRRLFFSAVCLSVFSAAAQTPQVMKHLHNTYTYVGPFEGGLAVVCRNGEHELSATKAKGRFGFVDTLSKVCIPLDYDFASTFSEATAVVGKGAPGTRKFGLMGRSGKLLAECEWDGIEQMNEGIAVVYKIPEYTYALIDSLGNRTDINYDYCKSFYNGCAVVGRGEWHNTTNAVGESEREFIGKKGFIDVLGKEIVPLQYDEARGFCEGLAAVGVRGKYYVKWGFVDRDGEVMIPCRYFDVGSFRNSRVTVCRISSDGKPVYGYSDPFGNEIIPCKYVMAAPFQFVNAWVGVVDESGAPVYMLIDSAGRDVLTYKVYDLNDSGKYGHASCAVRDGDRLLYGVLDSRGRIVVPFEYDMVTIYSGIDPKTGKKQERGIADKNGNKVSFILHNK